MARLFALPCWVALALCACSASNVPGGPVTPAPPTAPPVVQGHAWPAEAQATFRQDCADSGYPEVCGCMLAKARARFAWAEIERRQAAVAAGTEDPELGRFFDESAMACVDQLVAWPALARQQFLDECTRSAGGHRDVCACVLAAVEARYPFGRHAALQRRAAEGAPDPEHERFVAATADRCLDAAPDAEQAVIDSFLASCEQHSGGHRDVCACTLATLEARFGRKGLVARARKLGQGGVDAELEAVAARATEKCLAGSATFFAQLRGSFVAACQQSGGSEGVCGCVFDDLLRKYGREGFVRAARKAGGGEPEVGFESATRQATDRCNQDQPH